MTRQADLSLGATDLFQFSFYLSARVFICVFSTAYSGSSRRWREGLQLEVYFANCRLAQWG